MIQLSNGKILAPMGGGITTAVTSSKAMQEAIHVLNCINLAETAIDNNISKIYSSLLSNSKLDIELSQIDFNSRIVCIKNKKNSKQACINF
ncbi:hypothetical protein [Halobacteriovorax sp. JY17]|uniref:hypothetical protein n=1 Tax=Halobacteriovorax sp. JY17 TaxID=2014617 RepID=UPI000C37930E|nr:hypothetical protein [Halobacteriovorax sp. JY17]PIK13537.1 MAG: hypothetical protein CES88_15210 [Halobacteriovorax sp. JY17]